MPIHDCLQAGSVGLITGGAAGIGLAVARRLAGYGMSLVIVDNRDAALSDAADALRSEGAAEVMTVNLDVSDRQALEALKIEVQERFGGVDFLMNNAGIQPGSSLFSPIADWQRILDVNLMGIIHGSQVFAPSMIAAGRPGLIVNTGSKQGITTPPGDPAYNVAKSGVKTFTEALAHELRGASNPNLSAHLLIPGFVFTELTRNGRTEKPAGAWTPEQTADFMFEKLEQGDFYILCPDNDVSRDLDEKRMAWAIGDIIENRPPLSRWHKDYAATFEAYIKGA